MYNKERGFKMKKMLSMFLVAISISLFVIPFISADTQSDLWGNASAIYHMNGNANDVKNSNNGVASGAVNNASSAKIGSGGYYFDGSNDFINVSNSASLNLSTTISISTWINLKDAGSYPAITTKANSFGCWGFLYQFNSNLAKPSLFINQSNYVWTNDADTAVPLNTWHHIAVTYDGVNKLTYYLDGGANGTYTVDGGSFCTNGGNMVIGARYDGFHIKGMLDELIIFNYTLNQTEVNWLYNGGTGRELTEPASGSSPLPDNPYSGGTPEFGYNNLALPTLIRSVVNQTNYNVIVT